MKINIKTVKKLILILVITIVVGVVGYIGYVIYAFENFSPTLKPISQQKIIKEYNDNKATFLDIVNYIQSLDGNIGVYKNKNEKNQFLISQDKGNGSYNNPSCDEKTNSSIYSLLYKLGYQEIDKNDNSINFIKQSGENINQGIVYSFIEGESESSTSVLHVPICKDWYYYESRS